MQGDLLLVKRVLREEERLFDEDRCLRVTERGDIFEQLMGEDDKGMHGSWNRFVSAMYGAGARYEEGMRTYRAGSLSYHRCLVRTRSLARACMSRPVLFDNDPTSAAGISVIPHDGEVRYYPALFRAEDGDAVLDALTRTIEWKQDRIRIYGKEHDVPRLTAWYGDEGVRYGYSGLRMSAKAWTDELLAVKTRVESVAGIRFNSVLLNLYRNGSDSMGWHADDEPELGEDPVIASVSFGASRTFKLRHRVDKTVCAVVLDHGSLLLMKGGTQHAWEHAVPKTKKVLQPRCNLTFRVVNVT